jgi:hypothetical protein
MSLIDGTAHRGAMDHHSVRHRVELRQPEGSIHLGAMPFREPGKLEPQFEAEGLTAHLRTFRMTSSCSRTFCSLAVKAAIAIASS